MLGKMGLRDQNNGKKVGINGSRIYHVTTLLLETSKLMPRGIYFLYFFVFYLVHSIGNTSVAQ